MNSYYPKKQGLYDPQFEHDACGVGFVANIKGHKSHAIIRNGIEILEHVKRYDNSIAVIIMTAFSTVNNAVEAMKKGANDYLTKPFEPDELVMVLNRVIKFGHLEKENKQLKERLDWNKETVKLLNKLYSL